MTTIIIVGTILVVVCDCGDIVHDGDNDRCGFHDVDDNDVGDNDNQW